jgi:hypothetical protein
LAKLTPPPSLSVIVPVAEATEIVALRAPEIVKANVSDGSASLSSMVATIIEEVFVPAEIVSLPETAV